MGVVPLYIERGQVAAAVTGADQWGSLAEPLATDATVLEGQCGKQGLEAPAAGERLYKTQDRPSMIKEDFDKLSSACKRVTRKATSGWLCTSEPAGKPTAVADAFSPHCALAG